MIQPVNGRVVWFYPSKAHKESGAQPMAAQVAYVHSDRMVNVGYLDYNGVHQSATSVPLLQDDDAAPAGHFCEWMPYQKGQAQRSV